MNSTLDNFSKWAKKSDNNLLAGNRKSAVVYTRVSSKEQADKNLSLDFQRKTIDEYATRNTFNVLGYFGGTYESAKTDGRKEFGRMLDFIRKNKGRVSHVLVYTMDRFSRTGGGAIKIAQDLREKHGVMVFAVTQPTDTSNPSGVFQQNIHFLFSEFDNQLRKQRAMAGMKEKFEKGIWCLKPPMGYDVVLTNGERKIVVNKDGKLLKKAFQWKAGGMKNEEILEKLNAQGVKIYKQKLSMIFSNPFYCGIISTKMLDGRLVEGTHEKMISKDLFLEVNEVRKSANKYGVAHQKEQDAIPLKVFMKCSKCGIGFTGYEIKKKKLHYYKCRTKGCGCNKNAKIVNNQFLDLLQSYTIDEEDVAPMTYRLTQEFDQVNQSAKDEERAYKIKLSEIQKKIDTIEEKYFALNEMNRETYEKFNQKYHEEKAEILRSLQSLSIGSSNLEANLRKALDFSSKLSTVWDSSGAKNKELLQKFIFPDGIIYDTKNEAVLTPKANPFFEQIASLQRILKDSNNDKGSTNAALSCYVGMTRFELATPRPPDVCATGLRYIPNFPDGKSN
jgi:site-specific DNA recombinase